MLESKNCINKGEGFFAQMDHCQGAQTKFLPIKVSIISFQRNV